MVSELKSQARTVSAGQISPAQPVWQLAVLNLATSGLYFPYWFFRNWRDLKVQFGLKSSPWLRSLSLFVPVLNVIMIYSQFRTIRNRAEQAGVESYSSPLVLTLGFMTFNILLAAAKLERMQESINGAWLANASILFFILLATWVLVIVQDTLNNIWKSAQPESPLKVRLSMAEIVVLLAGILSTAFLFYTGAL